MGAVILIIFGLVMLIGPVAANAANHSLGALPTTILMVCGIAVTVVASIILTITKLYKKTTASEAFVRTGMGGIKVIMDGGCLVVPVIHQVVSISLKTLRLPVGREGKDALITKDKLRADVQAEFFVRVMPDSDSIQAAARSFGGVMEYARDNGRNGLGKSPVETLVEDKLISALRTVAATKTLEELNSERDAFVKEVTGIVSPDLKHNGLTLEVATISKLDQTEKSQLRADNIFDAQGLATIAAIVQKKKTEVNTLEKEGDQARASQDVATRKAILLLDQERATAEQGQAAQIAIITAQKRQEAEQKRLETEQAIAIKGVEKDKATQVAEQQKLEAIEVATREKLSAIAEAEAKKARSVQTQAEAEAKAEKARQDVTTVTVVAEADREQQKQVIAAKGAADSQYVTKQRAADAEAYTLKANAEGRKAASEADALAITTKADADSSAAKKRAEGLQAEQMVPITVKKAEVDVEQRRVEVLQNELEAREKHGSAAQEFELAKLRVSKEAEVRIESARATATLVSKITGTVVGTHEDVANLLGALKNGMGIANNAEGFLDAAGPQTQAAAMTALSTLTGLVQGLSQRLGGTAVPPASDKPVG